MSYQFPQEIYMTPSHEEFEERKIPQKPALSRSWRMGWWMGKVVSICGPAPFRAIQVSFDNNTLVTMIVTIMVTVYGNPGDFCAIVVFLIHDDNGSESVASSIDDHVEVELQCLVVNI